MGKKRSSSSWLVGCWWFTSFAFFSPYNLHSMGHHREPVSWHFIISRYDEKRTSPSVTKMFWLLHRWPHLRFEYFVLYRSRRLLHPVPGSTNNKKVKAKKKKKKLLEIGWNWKCCHFHTSYIPVYKSVTETWSRSPYSTPVSLSRNSLATEAHHSPSVWEMMMLVSLRRFSVVFLLSGFA